MRGWTFKSLGKQHIFLLFLPYKDAYFLPFRNTISNNEGGKLKAAIKLNILYLNRVAHHLLPANRNETYSTEWLPGLKKTAYLKINACA